MRNYLSHFPAWVVALLSSSIVLGIAIATFLLLGRYGGTLATMNGAADYPVPRGTLFFAAGGSPSASVGSALSYLYGENKNDANIANTVLESFFADFFTGEQSLDSFFTAFDSAPFVVLIRQDENEHYEWGFATASAANDEAYIPMLHRSFSNRFAPAIIRTRALPSGAMVTDVLASDTAVLTETEKWHGYTITRSTHQDSGSSFLTAVGNGMTVSSNSRDLLLFMLRSGIPHGKNALILHKRAFEALFAIFPSSDAMRFVQGYLSEEDDILSLSSFRCIP